MHIHHLNCGTFRPIGLYGAGSLFKRGLGVTHCLLVETEEGLVLVDTGFGTRDYTNPTFTVRTFAAFSAFSRDLEETAVRQVIRLGYDPANVKHIVVTHLHLDHVGGLPDFPQAKVHLYVDEYEAAMRPRNMEERYVCRREHWAHGPDWVVHSLQGDRWSGFDCTPPVKFGSTEFFLVPLTGHTRGHCAVVVRLPDGWLMHCGDAYVFHGDVHPERPFHRPFSRVVLSVMNLAKAFRAIGAHSPRLRTLLREHGDKVQLFCTHDPHEFYGFQAKETADESSAHQ